MSNSKVHSRANVPFLLENEPGKSKAKDRRGGGETGPLPKKLPPPPCENRGASFHGSQIPLPPCVFVNQPPSRSSSKRAPRKDDDPFWIAYKECTKSSGRGELSGSGANSRGGLKRGVSLFFCKPSCGVRDDSVARFSQVPLSKSRRQR